MTVGPESEMIQASMAAILDPTHHVTPKQGS